MSNNPTPVQDWTFEDAEAQFAEVFRLARTQGPQRISRPGGSVVVIPAEEFEKAEQAGQGSLLDLLRRGRIAGLGELDLTRKVDYGRDINL